MALWLDLRCDVNGPACFNLFLLGPTSKSRIVPKRLLDRTVREMENHLIDEGWLKMRNTLECPACRKRRMDKAFR